VFSFFATCGSAWGLRRAWCNHAYFMLGGLDDGMCRRTLRRLCDRGTVRCPHTLLEHSMDATAGRRAGLQFPQHAVNIATLSPCRVYKRPGLARFLLALPGMEAVTAVARSGLWRDVSQLEWCSRLQAEDFHHVCALLQWNALDPLTLSVLCDGPQRWARLLREELTRGALASVLAVVRPDWFTCWDEVLRDLSRWQELCLLTWHNIRQFFESAPDFLLTLPQTPGAGPTSSVWYRDMAEVMSSKGWQRVHLSGTIKLTFANHYYCMPREVICRRIVERGGRVHPGFLFEGGTAHEECVPLVHWDGFVPTPKQVRGIRTMAGQRTKFLRAVLGATAWGKSVWGHLWRDIQGKSSYSSLVTVLADLFH
jgi:hypothetical protein